MYGPGWDGDKVVERLILVFQAPIKRRPVEGQQRRGRACRDSEKALPDARGAQGSSTAGRPAGDRRKAPGGADDLVPPRLATPGAPRATTTAPLPTTARRSASIRKMAIFTRAAARPGTLRETKNARTPTSARRSASALYNNGDVAWRVLATAAAAPLPRSAAHRGGAGLRSFTSPMRPPYSG
jgi:hypothetical protein